MHQFQKSSSASSRAWPFSCSRKNFQRKLGTGWATTYLLSSVTGTLASVPLENASPLPAGGVVVDAKDLVDLDDVTQLDNRFAAGQSRRNTAVSH